jgi:hypothetical protein
MTMQPAARSMPHMSKVAGFEAFEAELHRASFGPVRLLDQATTKPAQGRLCRLVPAS